MNTHTQLVRQETKQHVVEFLEASEQNWASQKNAGEPQDAAAAANRSAVKGLLRRATHRNLQDNVWLRTSSNS